MITSLVASAYPRTCSRTALAPSASATSRVRSVELLSTTITSSTNSGMARSTFSTPSSSFRQGMMTVMVRLLYMDPTFSHDRASGYHGFYEAACDLFLVFGGHALRRGSGPRAHRVRAENGQGPGPVPGQPPHFGPRLPDCDRSEACRCRVHRPTRSEERRVGK